MEAELRQKMVLAREHYRHHEYDRAEPLVRQIIAEHPGSAEMFNILGVILHDRGLFSEAQQLFEQALHINPAYTEVALSLSIVYNDMGHYDKARETYGRAMAKVNNQPRQLDPFASGKLANMHADLAEAYRGLGLFEEAAIELRAALKLHPGFCDLHCQLAMVLSESGDRQGAVARYREAVAQNGNYAPAHIQLGAELYALGQRYEAHAAWERALLLSPGDKRVAIYLNLPTFERSSP